MVYQLDIIAIALIPPILFISYLTLQSSFGRLEDSKRHVEKLNCLYLSTVETLATAIDAKDEVTHGHIRRVQGAAVGLAKELGITDEPTLKAIEAGGLLHDTGKIAVPEHILNKPGKLTAAEFEKMKLHAPIGADILSSIDFPYPVVPIVRHHHENWDGTGYPDGLRGTDIPIGARILSVVDCFDALTSDRPYRSRMSNETAIAILLERRGTMYDPAIIDVFVEAHERLMPAETPMHPAAKAVGGARTQRTSPAPAVAVNESNVSEEILGVSSLARSARRRGDPRRRRRAQLDDDQASAAVLVDGPVRARRTPRHGGWLLRGWQPRRGHPQPDRLARRRHRRMGGRASAACRQRRTGARLRPWHREPAAAVAVGARRPARCTTVHSSPCCRSTRAAATHSPKIMRGFSICLRRDSPRRSRLWPAALASTSRCPGPLSRGSGQDPI